MQKTPQSSSSHQGIVFGASSVEDENINTLYNIVNHETMLYWKGVHARADCDFRARKTTHIAEWNSYGKVIAVCAQNHFHLRPFVIYSLWNHVFPSDIKAFHGVSPLDIIKFSAISSYTRDSSRFERLYRIFGYITKSFFAMRGLAASGEQGPLKDGAVKAAFIGLMKSGRIFDKYQTGELSKYFFALVPRFDLIMLHAKQLPRGMRQDFFNVFGFMGKEFVDVKNDSLDAIRVFAPYLLHKNVFDACR